jgi:predicted Rossmann fold flavoprotein
MASIQCALANAETTNKLRKRTVVIEKNTVSGRKLLLTGGGRCNLTHFDQIDEIVQAFGKKGRFLSYCLHKFTPKNVKQFLDELGLESIVEKDGCVFPASGSASEVRDCLIKKAKNLGVSFYFDKYVTSIAKEKGSFKIKMTSEITTAEKVIIATGGLSFPKTGSTGDGYRFARELGHTIVETKASLVPLVTREEWPGKIAGIAVENVKISAQIDNKKITTVGAFIFTDDGIGGPAVWNMSRYLTELLPALEKPHEITIDFVPQINQAELETRFTDIIAANPKKKVVNILTEFIPKRLSEVLCAMASCTSEIEANQLKKEIRKRLISKLKAVQLSIVRTRPIAEAIVTHGGVSTAEIEPKTMESKICSGLFFAGEIIDVDGPCGGYSLQVCWSTGALAGSSAAKNL